MSKEILFGDLEQSSSHRVELGDKVIIVGNRFVPDGTIGRVEYVGSNPGACSGSNSLWVNVESATGNSTWAVAPEQVRKIEREELPMLEYLNARGDKVSEATRNELLGELNKRKLSLNKRKLSGIAFRFLKASKCPEGNYVAMVYQDACGKVDVVYVRAGDFEKIMNGDFENYNKVVKEWGI